MLINQKQRSRTCLSNPELREFTLLSFPLNSILRLMLLLLFSSTDMLWVVWPKYIFFKVNFIIIQGWWDQRIRRWLPLKRQLFTDPKGRGCAPPGRPTVGSTRRVRKQTERENVGHSLHCDFPGKEAARLSWSFRTFHPEFAPTVHARSYFWFIMIFLYIVGPSARKGSWVPGLSRYLSQNVPRQHQIK